MEADTVPLGAQGPHRQDWRAELRGTRHGRVAGAGVGLGTRHLLTCAHVVTEAGDEEEVGVEFASSSPPLTTTARVLPGCWFPPRTDLTADLALLELADPLPAGAGAQLSRRLLPPGTQVQMLGFPDDQDFGRYVTATVAGPTGPGNEWLQLDTEPGRPIQGGFSGSGAVDLRTGDVVGMVVSRFRTPVPEAGLAWMIGVETILRYLPSLRQWTVGPPSIGAADDETAHEITSFLTHKGAGDVSVVVTGEQGSPAANALGWVVALSDPDQRFVTADQLEQLVQAGLVPPAGSIDLVVDAAGRTPEQVRQEIDGRLGRLAAAPARPPDGLSTGPAPVTLIVTGVDASTDSDTLVNQVLTPLTRQAPERGIRVLLGFRRPSNSSEGLRRTPLRDQVERLARRIDSLARAVRRTQRLRRQVAERIAGTPEVPDRVPAVRRQLAEIEADLAVAELDQLTELITAAEQRIEAESRAVHERRSELKAMLDRRRELSYRLGLLNGRAVGAGVAEQAGLPRLHRAAEDLLAARPCDLTAAAEAVDRYGRAVSRASDPGGLGAL